MRVKIVNTHVNTNVNVCSADHFFDVAQRWIGQAGATQDQIGMALLTGAWNIQSKPVSIDAVDTKTISVPPS